MCPQTAFPLQKSAADKSRLHRGRREADGAPAFHGLGESQAVPAAVQVSRGQQPTGERLRSCLSAGTPSHSLGATVITRRRLR